MKYLIYIIISISIFMQFACNESDKEQKLILEAIKICDEQNELINKESLIIAKTFESRLHLKILGNPLNTYQLFW